MFARLAPWPRPRPQTVATNPVAALPADDDSSDDFACKDRGSPYGGFDKFFDILDVTPPPFVTGEAAIKEFLLLECLGYIFRQHYPGVMDDSPFKRTPGTSVATAVGAGSLPAATAVQLSGASAGGAAVGKPGLSEGPTAAAPTDDSGDESGETPEGSEDDDLDIIVKLPNGKTFVTTMDESDLVTGLKDNIMNHEDYQTIVKDIRIIYKGRQLADDCRLMDYDMQDCAKVHVVLCNHGGGKKTMQLKTRITNEQKLHNMLAKYNQKAVGLNIPFGVIITKCLALLGNMNDSTEDIKTAVKNLGITQLRELAAHLEGIPKQGLRGDERLKQLFPMVYPIIDEFADGIKQLTLVHHNM
jgi:uncharacterized ubiquitin-like protein YukD